jgi:flagellar motor protein MotB
VPLPAPAVAAPAPVAPVAVAERPATASPEHERMAALGAYVEHLAMLQSDLAATVTTRGDEVVVKIGDAAGFAPGSADPSPAMRPLLLELRTIVAASPDLQVEVSGHTDDVPIKTAVFPSNLELSLARASRVAHELVATDKELRTRVSAAGYGEQRPVAANGDAEGRARNRRVEIRLTHAG